MKGGSATKLILEVGVAGAAACLLMTFSGHVLACIAPRPKTGDDRFGEAIYE